MTDNKKTGLAGEDLAARYLMKNGYEIVERNVSFPRLCEIDIIAKIKDTIVFVEVKTRKNDLFGKPFDAITRTKYENIRKGIVLYSQTHKIKKYRIDVIGITLKPELKIEHLKNVSI